MAVPYRRRRYRGRRRHYRPPLRSARHKLERTTGLEPATECLEGTDSTTELRPRVRGLGPQLFPGWEDSTAVDRTAEAERRARCLRVNPSGRPTGLRNWCLRMGSNHRRARLQRTALPLSYLGETGLDARYRLTITPSVSTLGEPLVAVLGLEPRAFWL
jgi:hypothetical protein